MEAKKAAQHLCASVEVSATGQQPWRIESLQHALLPPPTPCSTAWGYTHPMPPLLAEFCSYNHSLDTNLRIFLSPSITSSHSFTGKLGESFESDILGVSCVKSPLLSKLPGDCRPGIDRVPCSEPSHLFCIRVNDMVHHSSVLTATGLVYQLGVLPKWRTVCAHPTGAHWWVLTGGSHQKGHRDPMMPPQ